MADVAYYAFADDVCMYIYIYKYVDISYIYLCISIYICNMYIPTRIWCLFAFFLSFFQSSQVISKLQQQTKDVTFLSEFASQEAKKSSKDEAARTSSKEVKVEDLTVAWCSWGRVAYGMTSDWVSMESAKWVVDHFGTSY